MADSYVKDSSEASVVLPTGCESALPALFLEIDRSMDSLHVAAYGIEASTLEQVFLRIAQEADEEAEDLHHASPVAR